MTTGFLPILEAEVIVGRIDARFSRRGIQKGTARHVPGPSLGPVDFCPV